MEDIDKCMTNDKAVYITLAFYKAFWPKLSYLVTLAIDNGINNHSFPYKHKTSDLDTLTRQGDKT